MNWVPLIVGRSLFCTLVLVPFILVDYFSNVCQLCSLRGLDLDPGTSGGIQGTPGHVTKDLTLERTVIQAANQLRIAEQMVAWETGVPKTIKVL